MTATKMLAVHFQGTACVNSFVQVVKNYLCSGFSSRYSGFRHCCIGTKACEWLDRMLHHREDQTIEIGIVDVEGTKNVKRMINLLAITGQFIRSNRRGSYRWIQAVGSRC